MWEYSLLALIFLEGLSIIANFIIFGMVLDDSGNYALQRFKDILFASLETPLFIIASYHILSGGIIHRIPGFWRSYYKFLLYLLAFGCMVAPLYYMKLGDEGIDRPPGAGELLSSYLISPVMSLANIYLFWLLYKAV